MTPSPRRTALYESHKRLGARFTEFGGWEMPVQYTGVIDEHQTVRNKVGLFDVSHMGEFTVRGNEALKFLQYVTSNDVSRLVDGQAQYSLLLNPQGGVVDDIIVYRLTENDYFICVNAANTEKDFAWLKTHNTFSVKLEDVSQEYAQVALQGPEARNVMAKYFAGIDLSFTRENFPPFTCKVLERIWNSVLSVPFIIASTGYTGDDGFEIFCPASFGLKLWEGLLNAGSSYGIKPIGLGARDTLRLESCYALHGHELADDITALSSKVARFVKFRKGDFIGREALLKQKAEGVTPLLVGLEVLSPGIIRQGIKLYSGSEEIGWVSSGTKTPTLNKAVGLGFVKSDFAALGTGFEAEVRERRLKVRVIQVPFYRREV